MSVTHVTLLPAQHDFVSKATERFPANSEVGSDHTLGHTLYAISVGLSEFQIFFLCCFCMGLHQPFLRCDEVILYDDAEIMFKPGNGFHEFIPGRLTQ